jgi:hypothetical protein
MEKPDIQFDHFEYFEWRSILQFVLDESNGSNWKDFKMNARRKNNFGYPNLA